MTTFSTLQPVSLNLDRWRAITAKSPAVTTATNYYKANIGSATTIDAFVANRRLFTYAMNAFGLGDMVNSTALIKKALQQGSTDSTALANTLNNPKILAFVKAFDFAGQGAAAVTQTAATDDVVSAYVQQQLEMDQGKQDKGVGLALYFQRKAPSIKSVYDILADKNLLTVVQTTLGISPMTSAQNIDTQAAMLKKLVNLTDFQDPKKLQSFIGRYAAQYDVQSAQTAAADTSGGYGLSLSLLSSLQGLRIGGF